MTFANNSNYDQLPVLKGSGESEAKSDPWGPDIAHNLLDQVEDTAVGLVTLPWHMAKAGVHDAKVALTGKGKFESDDIARNIVSTTWEDLKFRWQPLVEGEFGTWWDHIEEDPLGMILDVATVATLGAAGVGQAAKAGVAAGKATTLGMDSAKLAGLAKKGKTLDEVAVGLELGPAALKVAGGEARAAETVARRHVKREGGVIDPQGNVYEPATAKLKLGESGVDVPLHRNPVIRARQKAGVAISNKFPDAFGIGSNARASRKIKFSQNAQAARSLGATTRRFDNAMRPLDQKQRLGMSVAALARAGMAPQVVRSFYAKKLDDAIGKQDELAAVTIRERIAQLEDPDVTRWVDEQNWTPEFREAMEAANELSRDNTRKLWEMLGRPDPRQSESLELARKGDAAPGKASDVEGAFEAFWRVQAGKEAHFILEEMDQDVLRAAYAKHKGGVEFDSASESFVDAAGNKVDVEIDLADLIGDPDALAFVRPHTSRFKGYAKKADGSLAHLKKDTGYSFGQAFDLFSPEGLKAVARNVNQYALSKQRVATLVQTGRRFTSNDRPPRGWVAIEDDAVLGYARALREFVDEDLRVTFGEGPLLDRSRTVVEGLLAKAEGEGVLFAPKRAAQDFMREAKSANAFLKGYDNVTDFWRSWVLTMRPAWITGNLFGNLLMMLGTHGLAKSVAAYFQAFRMGTKERALLDKHAPDVLSAGLLRSSLDHMMRESKDRSMSQAILELQAENARLPRVQAVYEKFGSFQTKMGNLNAAITDDAGRRAAFLAEVRPHVKAIRREHPELDWDEAADLFLSDPKVVDDLANKVLSDLVNFRDLSDFERSVVRRVVPFYSWIKGASGRSMRFAMDEPWKAWAAMQSAEIGTRMTEDEIGGELPDYLRGALTVGDVEDGDVRIIPTNALNPFATLGDTAGMAKSLLLGDIQVGGNNPASSMSPLVKAPIESFTNRDLFYGTPLDRSGRSSIGQRLALQAYHSFPQTRSVEKAMQSMGPLSGSTLYTPSLLDQLLSYFGAPTKQLNVAEADERARAQESGLGANLI